MTRRLAALLILAAFLAGVLICRTVNTVSQPHCPTEDSCRPMYEDGRWHISEDTP